MAAVTITGFQGMVPSGNPKLLPDTAALYCENTMSRFSDLRPLPSDSVSQTVPTGTKTIFKSQLSGWLTSTSECNYARLPLNRNDSERVYYTGDGAPKMKPLSGDIRTLGVTFPSTKLTPTVRVVDELTVDEASTEAVAWDDSVLSAVDTIVDACYSAITYTTPVYSPASFSYSPTIDATNPAQYIIKSPYNATTSSWLGKLIASPPTGFYDRTESGVRYIGVKIEGIPKIGAAQINDVEGLKATLAGVTDPNGDLILDETGVTDIITSISSKSGAPSDGTSSLDSTKSNYDTLSSALNRLCDFIATGTAATTTYTKAEYDAFYQNEGVVSHIDSDYEGYISALSSLGSAASLVATIKSKVTTDATTGKKVFDLVGIKSAVTTWASGYTSAQIKATPDSGFTSIGMTAPTSVSTLASYTATWIQTVYSVAGRLYGYRDVADLHLSDVTSAKYVSDVGNAIFDVTSAVSAINAASVSARVTKEQLKSSITNKVTSSASAYTPSSEPVVRIEVSSTWVFTWVSDLGEESSPSEASVIVNYDQNDVVSVTRNETAPEYVVGWRLYRSNSSTQSTEFQLVTKTKGDSRDGALADLMTTVGNVQCIPLTTITVYDTAESEYLEEVCPSFGWIPPEADLKGLTSMPNGIMVGFKDSTLMFCEPWKPHAWPTDYDKPLQQKITGLGSFGQTLFVGTEGKPYVVSGADSAGMSEQLLDFEQACLSQRSITSLGSGIAYAAPDGLAIVANGVAPQIATLGKISQGDWQAMQPSKMFGVFHDSYIFMFHPTGCLVWDLMSQQLFQISVTATSAFVDPITDTLYYVNGTNMYALFGGSTLRTAKWNSKTWRFPNPSGFSWMAVDSDFATPVTVRIYAEGELLQTIEASDAKPKRVKAKNAYDWKFEVETSTNVVTFISFASSIDELKQVM